MVTRRALIAFAMLLALLSGCTPTVTGSASPSPPALDFTKPAVAQTMVRQLLVDAGSQKALMVKITATTAQVSVLKGDQVITWAYRDGKSAKAASDLAYVNQATFDVAKFSFSDVGALFRAAAGQSGSATNQSLTIVDNSASQVMMSVSTEPESRTVFFTADGALMAILDFDTVAGIGHGISDAIGTSQLVYSVTVISDQGVSAEFPGSNGTTIRRTRAAKVPATTRVLSSAESLPLFAASRVKAATIWKVVGEIRGTDGVSDQSEWSVTIDNRDSLSMPRMHFTFGFKVVVTDLDGNIVSQ
jgi:hypothetical protein